MSTSSPLSLDHLVIHVKDLAAAVAQYTALGFTVQDGGTHADGNTHNALIGFADGSYLELIAFLKPAASHRWGRHQQSGYEGFVDFALLPHDVSQVVQRAQAQGLNYQGPIEGGRLRPDGERLVWQLGIPPTPDLPFLCGDVTPRALRVREGEVRVHANGVQGVAALTLVVRDLATSLAHYLALLGAAEPLLGPTVLSGLGIEQAVLSLGTQRLVLLAPVADADTAPARSLQHLLDTRGEGVLGASLRLGAGHPATSTHALPLAATHGAPFEWTPA